MGHSISSTDEYKHNLTLRSDNGVVNGTEQFIINVECMALVAYTMCRNALMSGDCCDVNVGVVFHYVCQVHHATCTGQK